MTLHEPFRPHYHFTPPANWMNDPNGLVYYRGEYHLFYQHYPQAMVHGPMHWGHAVSRDLIRWEHLPVALRPDALGTIYSGVVVIDWHNTAGFGPEAMVAIFTHHLEAGHIQRQSLAYSTDRGRTWTKYEGNPVIPTPENTRDFRDPKVFWHDDYWVMVLAVGHQIWFYTSPDLKRWAKTGEFGAGYGCHSGVWEMPDLVELPIDNEATTLWVLLVGVAEGAPAGGSGVQYFSGKFDGRTFIPACQPDEVRWVDFGPDFYAGLSWSDAPDQRRLWLGWMNNWTYAALIPTSPWRGTMTIPRELSLSRTGDTVQLIQRPVAELQALRGKKWQWQNLVIENEKTILDDIAGNCLEISLEVQVAPAAAGRFGLCLRTTPTCQTVVGYDFSSESLFVDRTCSGEVAFHPEFAATHAASMPACNGLITLDLLVDRSSIELFGNGGRVVFSEQIFPERGQLSLELFCEAGSVVVTRLEAYDLGSYFS